MFIEAGLSIKHVLDLLLAGKASRKCLDHNVRARRWDIYMLRTSKSATVGAVRTGSGQKQNPGTWVYRGLVD